MPCDVKEDELVIRKKTELVSAGSVCIIEVVCWLRTVVVVVVGCTSFSFDAHAALVLHDGETRRRDSMISFHSLHFIRLSSRLALFPSLIGAHVRPLRHSK